MNAACRTVQPPSNVSRSLAWALLFGAVAMAACQSAPAVTPVPLPTASLAPTSVPTIIPTTTVLPQLAAEDEIGIYAAVLRNLYGPDDTFGGSLQAPVAYILIRTDDRAGDPLSPSAAAVELSETVQTGIATALADLPTEIIWVSAMTDVPIDSQTGAVKGGGAVFRVGNIMPQPAGRVQVAGSIYIANLAAGGTTYVLEKQGTAWTVIGNTGSQWIS